jgi:hypothetical protein
VPGRTSCRELEAEDALLGAAQPVAAPAVVLENVAATLVEEHLAADLVWVRFAQPTCADIATGLLVGDEHELERPTSRPPAVSGQRNRGHGFSRDLRLHVERPAAPQEAVRDIARPGVVPPLGRIREHGVDMPEVHKRRAVAAAERRDQVRAIIDGGKQLGLEARLLQVVGEVFDRRTLVARRIDGVEANEPLQDFGRLPLEIRRRHELAA